MNKQVSAARARINIVLLCSLVLSGLTACGTESAAPQAHAAASGDGQTLIPTKVGLIDRSTGQPATPPKTANPISPPTTAIAPPGGNGNTSPGHPPIKVNGSTTIDWTPPTQNIDGTALTNLAGYTVYYGSSPNQLTHSVKLSNPGLTAYTVSNLPPGTWYFVVTSYSSSGIESLRSGVVSTTI
jgi:hypothetical protein